MAGEMVIQSVFLTRENVRLERGDEAMKSSVVRSLGSHKVVDFAQGDGGLYIRFDSGWTRYIPSTGYELMLWPKSEQEKRDKALAEREAEGKRREAEALAAQKEQQARQAAAIRNGQNPAQEGPKR